MELFMNICSLMPDDTQCEPPGSRGRAVEEKMLNSFFIAIMTEDTRISLLKELPSSPRYISCVESIIEQKPCKEFNFGNAF
jgi:hypothetical protein